MLVDVTHANCMTLSQALKNKGKTNENKEKLKTWLNNSLKIALLISLGFQLGSQGSQDPYESNWIPKGPHLNFV